MSYLSDEAYRRFPDEVHKYSEDEINELASLGVAAHPNGKIIVDRGNLRYAFLEGARFRAAKELETETVCQQCRCTFVGDDALLQCSDHLPTSSLTSKLSP